MNLFGENGDKVSLDKASDKGDKSKHLCNLFFLGLPL